MIETIGNTEKDERGNAYYGIDEDIRDRLRSERRRQWVKLP